MEPAGPTPPDAGSPQSAGVRLKLLMPTQSNQRSNPTMTPDALSKRVEQDASGSPERPSYSPVTPTLPHAVLKIPEDDQVQLPPQWMEEPDSIPVNLDENPDAIALRAAISILQMQRQQSLRDIRNLDHMKQAALQDPEQFIRDLGEGKLNSSPRATVEVDDIEPAEAPIQAESSTFGKFPSAQNVVRAPPIEWAKYHVTGEPLDRLHEVQRHYPGFSEESVDDPRRQQPHTIAAPYRPFADKIENGRMPPRSGNQQRHHTG